MKTCSVCGFHNLDRECRCGRCSALLGGEVPYELEDALAKKPLPGAELIRRILGLPARLLGRFLPGLRRGAKGLDVELPKDVADRSPWTAGFLGLIPGAGQLYNRQPKKALYFIAAWAAIAALVAFTFYRPISNVFLAAMVLWMAYSFHDGVKTAMKINQRYWDWRISVGAYCAWIFYVAALSLGLQWALSWGFVKLRYISEPVFEPTIHYKDKIAVNVIGMTLFGPKVGDLVLYDPKKVSIEAGPNLYIVNANNGIERILAGPGETFERRGEKYFRNGIEVGPEQGPLVTAEVTWDYKLTAPPGHYVILHSYNPPEYFNMSSLTGADTTPPKMYAAHVRDWNDACLIPREAIMGRVWAIYQPPEHRRFVRNQAVTRKRLAR